METVISRIGSLEGVVLPKEALDRLGLALGDRLEVVATGDGIRLVRPESDLALQMREAGTFMDKYHDALSQLAE